MRSSTLVISVLLHAGVLVAAAASAGSGRSEPIRVAHLRTEPVRESVPARAPERPAVDATAEPVELDPELPPVELPDPQRWDPPAPAAPAEPPPRAAAPEATVALLEPLRVAEPALAAPPVAFVPAVAIDPQNRPPVYPPRAVTLAQQGTVLLRVAVGADGSVESLAIARTSGFELLDRAALHAMRSWRFRPATRDGIPVLDVLEIPVEFRLSGG